MYKYMKCKSYLRMAALASTISPLAFAFFDFRTHSYYLAPPPPLRPSHSVYLPCHFWKLLEMETLKKTEETCPNFRIFPDFIHEFFPNTFLFWPDSSCSHLEFRRCLLCAKCGYLSVHMDSSDVASHLLWMWMQCCRRVDSAEIVCRSWFVVTSIFSCLLWVLSAFFMLLCTSRCKVLLPFTWHFLLPHNLFKF